MQGENYMRNFLFPQPASSTPWAPSWSPDGRAVAVGMAGSIWRVDVATGDAVELTSGPGYHSSPDWSRDGRWIVYTSDDGRRTINLEILDVATGRTHSLTGDGRDSTLVFDPVFSPDGTKLAYVSTRPSGHFNVYVRPIKDGAWSGDEVPVTTEHSFGRDRLYFGPWDMHITPAWFPDGKELLLVSNREAALGSGDVWRVPVAPDAMSRARAVLREQSLYRTRPSISLDGKRFVYASAVGGADEFNNLYVQPTSGGQPYKLTFFGHDAFNPRWSPDGESIAFISNEQGLPQLAILETYGGALRTVPIRRRTWRRPMALLRIRTVDGAFNRTTAARIHLTASDGKFYAPADAFARITGEGDHVFHSPGSVVVAVPAGRVSLLAVKGFEYQPDSTSRLVKGGDTVAVTLVLRRISELTRQGWHNGSTHVHANYGGTLHNTVDNLLMMSAAEDQDIVIPLVANKDNRILDRSLFTPGGGAHPLSTRERVVFPGEEYRSPIYGHTLMLGMRDHLVSPFTTGYEGTAIESPVPTNTDMLRRARVQGAFTAYVHAFRGDADPFTFALGQGKGFLLDAALGATDAIEWSYGNRSSFYPWYAALNAGLHITAIGGEDAISNMHQTKLVGSMRTFVQTDARGLAPAAILDAMKRGRSFVTNGPLVQLRISGHPPGDTIVLPQGGSMVRVDADVRSIVPLSRVWLVQDGRDVRDVPLSSDRRSAHLSAMMSVRSSGWIHLRAEGDERERFPLDAAYAQALTNPVWFLVGGASIRDANAARYGQRWIDTLRVMLDRHPGWRSDAERKRVASQLDSAAAVFRRLEREATTAKP